MNFYSHTTHLFIQSKRHINKKSEKKKNAETECQTHRSLCPYRDPQVTCVPFALVFKYMQQHGNI